MNEYLVCRLFADARVQRIYGGTKRNHEGIDFACALSENSRRSCRRSATIAEHEGDFTDLFVLGASHKLKIAQQ